MDSKAAILESRVEQLEVEVNELKCCGNCFYGAPSNEGMLCMTKTGKIIAGIGMAAIAALGTYFLYGKRREKKHRIIAGWMLRMKGEVLEKVEEIKELNKELNKEEYYKIVDEISARYAKLGKVGAAELKHLTAELKGSWANISKQFE